MQSTMKNDEQRKWLKTGTATGVSVLLPSALYQRGIDISILDFRYTIPRSRSVLWLVDAISPLSHRKAAASISQSDDINGGREYSRSIFQIYIHLACNCHFQMNLPRSLGTTADGFSHRTRYFAEILKDECTNAPNRWNWTLQKKLSTMAAVGGGEERRV